MVRIGAAKAPPHSPDVAAARQPSLVTAAAGGPPPALARGFSMRASLHRLRASTQLPSGMHFRNSVRDTLRVRSNSIELLLFEVRSAFDPSSRAIHVWHQTLLGCMLYEVAVLPYLVTFQSNPAQWLTTELAVVYACELLFLADIYVELNTGYYEDGNVTRDAKKSRVKYLKSVRFVLDVVALPPLSLLPVATSFSPVYLELHKFVRVWRIPKYIALLDDLYARHFELLKMFKVLLVILLLSHFVACGRFWFGYDTHGNNHWLPKVPLHEHSELTKYLMSLFWAFGLLTGLYEGELPHALVEFWFTMAVGLCGFSLFTYLCATFFMISKCESSQSEAAEARINQFKHLLSFHHVPEELKEQAVGYLKRYYTHSESNDREAMRLLCPSISKDIRVALVKDMVAKIPYFQDCNEQFVIVITSLLEMISLPANFVLFNAGDTGDAMYLVNSGVLHVVVDGIKVREVRKGNAFGEMSIFLNRPRFATIVTTTYCTLYKLARFHMDRMLEGYPQYAVQIPQHVEEMASIMFRNRNARLSMADLGRQSMLGRMGKKKTITTLIRKHIIRDKGKVVPSVMAAVSAMSSARVNSMALPPVATTTPSDAASATPAGLTIADIARNALRQQQQQQKESGGASEAADAQPTTPATAKQEPSPPETEAQAPSAPSSPIVVASTTVNRDGSLMRNRNSSLAWATGGHAAFIQQFGRPDAPLWSVLLLRKAIDFETKRRMWWLLLLQINWMHNWTVVPLFMCFELLEDHVWVVEVFNTIMDLILWADLYVNLNQSYMDNAEKIVDTTKTARRYFKKCFLVDLLPLLPYRLIGQITPIELARVPRLLLIWRISGHFHEVDAFLQLTSKQRLMLLSVGFFMLYHVVACLYFSFTYVEGFSPSAVDAWMPSDDIYLRKINATHFTDINNVTYAATSVEIDAIVAKQYFRSLYYACNVLTALGRTIEPVSDNQYGTALVFMLCGFFITATVIDIVQKRFTASALDQKEFFSTRSRIQMFLRRQNAPLVIHKRVNAFLDYWWSAHRGAFIGRLLEELPQTIKHDIMCSVCKPVLQTLALMVGVRPVLSDLEQVFVDNIKFILYGQGETIYRQGDYAGGVFFLLEGEVGLIISGSPPRSIPSGGFFGTAALRLSDDSASFRERATAISGCVLLFASREHLRAMMMTFPSLTEALGDLEKRFLDPKLAKASAIATFNSVTSDLDSTSTSRFSSFYGALAMVNEIVFDPDTTYIMVWETWVFIAMTVQWASILLRVCFGVEAEGFAVAEAILVLFEVTFLIDMFVRCHLGYYEFGNKIMDVRLVKQRYLRSPEFAIDLVALLPLYSIYWGMVASSPSIRANTARMARLELLNLNKLARLLKVPTQLAALENKYVKFTLELRVFKLVYYTFLLSHVFACIWFDFSNRSSYQHALSMSLSATSSDSHTSEESESGLHKWLPPPSLLRGNTALQYFASLFWSFGIMSASTQGELPKDVTECLCSIGTMTCGFFLFAYVIGNFSNIIDLMDAENREFYAKLSSLRHLLAHFNLPPSVQERFKAYFFFKRFHTITQEHLLEQCLPPSLLTDIRMVHLQPMIMMVSFLADMEGSVTRMLVAQFSQVMVVKDEFVYKFGEVGSDMYFVFTGKLDSLLPHDEFVRESSVIEPNVSVAPADDAQTGENGSNKRGSSRRVVAEQQGSPSAPPRRSPLSQSPNKIHPRLQHHATGGIDFKSLAHLNSIEAGSYFGENALFVNSVRNTYVVARSSCILYKLSRNSLELVFNRYPEWKQKVLRIMKVQQEQHRLNRIAQEEMRSIVLGMELFGEDELSAERTEEEMLYVHRVRAATSARRKASLSPRFLHAQQSHDLWRYTPRQLLRLPASITSVFYGGASALSKVHLAWLKLVALATLLMAILVPYRISFDKLNRVEGGAVILLELETVCEFVFFADIWFNWKLRRSSESMDLYEQDHQQAYRKERLLWNVLAALPIDYVVISFSSHPVYRLNRCVKLRNFFHYMRELNRRSLHNEMHRLRTTFVLYFVFIYWGAAMFFAIAVYDHFGHEWNAWLPDASLADPDKRSLRLVRGLFFAMTAFVKKGRTFTPDSTSHFIFTISTCFIGLLIMAYMIGEIANLFISYIGDEVEYRKNFIAVEHYMARWKIAGDLKTRIQAFMLSLWFSHRGVDYQSLLEEVPPSIRTESVLNIADSPLQAFVDDVFRPICRAEPPGSVYELTQAIARHLKFEGFPRGEDVLVEGSIAKSMYFVVRGALHATSRSHPGLYRDLTFCKGDYFGEMGLLGYSVGVFSVRTLRACDLLSLRAEALLQVLKGHRVYSLAFEFAENAVQSMKQRREAGSKEDQRVSTSSALSPPKTTGVTLETQWGTAMLAAIQQKYDACSPEATSAAATSSASDLAALRRANKKICATINTRFSLQAPEEVYASFRPLIQLLMPNGLLHLFGARLAAVGGASTLTSSMFIASSEEAPSDSVTAAVTASSGSDTVTSSSSIATSTSGAAAPGTYAPTAKLVHALSVGKDLAPVAAPTRALVSPRSISRVNSKQSCGSNEGGGFSNLAPVEDAVEDPAHVLQWLQTADELPRDSPIATTAAVGAPLTGLGDESGLDDEEDEHDETRGQHVVSSELVASEGQSARTTETKSPRGSLTPSDGNNDPLSRNFNGGRGSSGSGSAVSLDFRRENRAQSRHSFVTAGATMEGANGASSGSNSDPLRRRSRVFVALTRRESVNRLVTTLNPGDVAGGSAGANGAPQNSS